jgi:transcriptional regulator EpsA
MQTAANEGKGEGSAKPPEPPLGPPALLLSPELPPKPALHRFQPSTEDGAILLRILCESLRVNRHYELLLWLSGELQQFLPHNILISAWGDFSRRDLILDVVSALPGVRTDRLKDCRIHDLVTQCYAQWVERGRRPLVASWAGAGVTPDTRCACSIHDALRGMRSLLVHGFRDERSGHESLYICFNPASFTRGRCKEDFLSMVDLLLGPIDAAFRRVAVLPIEEGTRAPAADDPFDLSPREREIVACLCEGKNNAAIAATLRISMFTVKNHLQRIFEKTGATNRTEVVAAYNRMRGPACLSSS